MPSTSKLTLYNVNDRYEKIPILHVCDWDENKPKEFFADENLLQFCSTDKGKSDIVVAEKVIRRRADLNAHTNSSTSMKKKMPLINRA